MNSMVQNSQHTQFCSDQVPFFAGDIKFVHFKHTKTDFSELGPMLWYYDIIVH